VPVRRFSVPQGFRKDLGEAQYYCVLCGVGKRDAGIAAGGVSTATGAGRLYPSSLTAVYDGKRYCLPHLNALLKKETDEPIEIEEETTDES
jgi:hypothetical protein